MILYFKGLHPLDSFNIILFLFQKKKLGGIYFFFIAILGFWILDALGEYLTLQVCIFSHFFLLIFLFLYKKNLRRFSPFLLELSINLQISSMIFYICSKHSLRVCFYRLQILTNSFG